MKNDSTRAKSITHALCLVLCSFCSLGMIFIAAALLGWNDDNSWGDEPQTAHAEGQAAPMNDNNVDGGLGLTDEAGAPPGREGGSSGRPDYSKRGGNDHRPDWRELHGIKSENTEDVERAVDNLVTTLQTVEVKLADKQADVNSPLFSAKTFEQLGLDEALLKGLYAMKFVKPSKVQERALPLLLSNPPQNMIAQSQSGTGKTAAFSLTMLSRVDPDLDAVQVSPPDLVIMQSILGRLCCAHP